MIKTHNLKTTSLLNVNSLYFNIQRYLNNKKINKHIIMFNDIKINIRFYGPYTGDKYVKPDNFVIYLYKIKK